MIVWILGLGVPAQAWRRGGGSDPALAWENRDAEATLRALARVSGEDGAARLLKARALVDLGRLSEALLALDVISRTEPLRAHLLARRAEIQARLGLHAAAARDYGRVMTCDLEPLAERARIGRAWQLWLAGRSREAAAAFRGLRGRYPHYPAPSRWQSAEASSRLLAGEKEAAAKLLRQLLVESPGSPEAAGSRETLVALEREGVTVPPLSPREELGRLLALGATGDLRGAQSGLWALQRRGGLPPGVIRLAEAKLLLSAYRYAEAVTILEPLAQGSPLPERVEALALLPRAQARAGIQGGKGIDPAEVRSSHRGIQALHRTRPTRLRLVDHLERGEYQEAHLLLHGMDKTPTLRRAYVAIRAGALGQARSDLQVLLAQPRHARGARYWLARLLSRQGSTAEATRVLEDLALEEELDWYSLLARARLTPLHATTATEPRLQALHRRSPRWSALAAELQALAPQHPRLGRAAVLLRLGLRDEAALELAQLAEEVILSEPHSRRASTLRPLSPEAAWRGERHLSRPRPVVTRPGPHTPGDPKLERLLHRAFWTLDEPYLANRFHTGSQHPPSRPLPTPFSQDLVPLARAHSVPAGHLWAVMTVESAYCPNVVSSAGAIGLLQIMPRTGWRIAKTLGDGRFHLDDLYVPEVNLRYGAWYLAALLVRFGGQLPLALAAYNGGPHNVTRWLGARAVIPELDAFVEEIPFAETRRYVKKVIGLAARYGVEIGEPITDLVRLQIDPTVSNHVDF